MMPSLNVFNAFLYNYYYSNGHEFFAKSSQSIGGRYWKALFFEYTNSSFTEKKPKEKYLGFLGPVIRAEVGDTIVVHFKNKVRLSISVQKLRSAHNLKTQKETNSW